MAAVNKVILVGNLGRDPEVRYTAEGAAICNFTMATTDSWKDKGTGEKKERTEWHRVVLFGRLAEVMAEMLDKGRQVYVEGRLQTRKWEKDGIERYTTEIVVDQRGSLVLLGPAPDRGYQAPRDHNPPGRRDEGYGQASQSDRGYDPEDDIPF